MTCGLNRDPLTGDFESMPSIKNIIIPVIVAFAAVVAWFFFRKSRDSAVIVPQTYDGLVNEYNGSKTLLVAVYAPWASVWRATAEALVKVDLSRYDIKLINADTDKQAVRDLGVEIIPTVLVIRGGQETVRLPNMMSLDRIP